MDPEKATDNWLKHGIRFEQAASVFRDTKFSHKRFVETEPLLKGLKLTMGADTTGDVARKFGVWVEHDRQRRRLYHAERDTVLACVSGERKNEQELPVMCERHACELSIAHRVRTRKIIGKDRRDWHGSAHTGLRSNRLHFSLQEVRV